MHSYLCAKSGDHGFTIAPQDRPGKLISSMSLLELAKKRFADDWSEPDERLFKQTELGKVADYGEGNPGKADTWKKTRILKANRIVWLCTDPQAIKAVTHRGVWIKGARIDGVLDLSYAKIEFPLSIKHSAVPLGMTMLRTQLYALFLDGTHTGPITADGLRVEQDVYMRNGFCANGEVRLLGATIGGSLDCTQAHFSNVDGSALNADGIVVKGSVFLRNKFKAEGVVRLLDATIGGVLDCNGAHFLKPDGTAPGADQNHNDTAFQAGRIVVKGDVFLSNGFKAEGAVSLVGGAIGGSLDCQNSHFINPDGTALNAAGIEVGGNVFLRKQFRAEGAVVFTVATVDGHFQWRGVKEPKKCALRLDSAKIGTLWDDENSWPAKLYLDGLVYDRIHTEAPIDSDARLLWLGLQGYDKDKYVPQPYEQLAKVLKQMGHEADARRILIAKQEDPARVAAMGTLQRWGHKLLGVTIGYGYRAWLAAYWIVPIILFGAVMFFIGSQFGQFQTTITGNPPEFNPFVYSLDSFVPLIDFHQAKYRLPSAWWLRLYHWFHIGMGWSLSTLFVVGLTGLVRK